MHTLVDLKSQDSHIRSCEAFVENQRRIIAAHAALGEPTEKAEHWLGVFQSGLIRHRRRRAEMLDLLAGALDEEAPVAGADQPGYSFGGSRGLGRAAAARPAPHIAFERRRARAVDHRR